jgi:hypothetical protein
MSFSEAMSSLFLPKFLAQLSDPLVKNVLMVGTGGGFDFVHSLLLVPELRRLGKTITMASFSFGQPTQYGGDATKLVWSDDQAVPTDSGNDNSATNSPAVPALASPMIVKLLSDAAKCTALEESHYAPELHVLSYLDAAFPSDAPHAMYAHYARAWTINSLHKFYAHLVAVHDIHAVIAFDGGTDSLVLGDEAGLGDPIEDAVTVGALARITNVKYKLLITVGFGCDRFNGVGDCASLRAVAELTAANAFLGSLSLHADAEPYQFYRAALNHIYGKQTFRSVLAGATCAAVEGSAFGFAFPEELDGRMRGGIRPRNSRLFVWPLMAMLFAFDIDKVSARSQVVRWIQDANTVADNMRLFARGREAVTIRPVEELPLQANFH